jgi:hypothetical protein
LEINISISRNTLIFLKKIAWEQHCLAGLNNVRECITDFKSSSTTTPSSLQISTSTRVKRTAISTAATMTTTVTSTKRTASIPFPSVAD